MTRETEPSSLAAAMDLRYWQADSPAYRRLLAAKTALEDGKLGRRLLTLVYLRVSQINGCNYCIDLHQREAAAIGRSPAELAGLRDWRDSTLFSERERAALAWVEAVTLLGDARPDDDLRVKTAAQFLGSELIDLALAAAIMNALNRLAISFARLPD